MKILRPLKAIRAKCIDCCGGSTSEVKNCEIEDCPLFPYRHGKRPAGVRRDIATRPSLSKKRNAGAGFEEKKAISQPISDHHGE